jgi:heterodisulfide reductase subunit C
MKATSHWLELKGHTPKSPSMHFDEEFSSQVIARGKIEEGRIMQGFFRRTGQPLMQDWLVELVKRMLRHLPVGMLTRMGLATLVAPRTCGWSRARDAIRVYADEQHAKQRRALGLTELVETAGQDAGAPARS